MRVPTPRLAESATRQTRLKRFLAATAVAVLAVAATACGSSGDADSGAVTTLTLSTNQSHKAFMDPLIEKFEKVNPDIKVEPTYSALDQRTRLLATQLRAGNAPDIIAVAPGWGGSSALLGLAEAGELADLSGAAWAKDYDNTMLPTLGVGGKVQGFVLPYQFVYLMYNSALFDELGVTPPKTFDELLGMCRTITAKGKIPIAISGGSQSMTSTMMVALASNNVYGPDPDWNDKKISGATTFASSPQWQAVFNQFKAMVDAQCFDKLATGQTELAQATAQVANGTAVMMVGSSNSYSSLRALNPNGKTGVTAFPGVTEQDTYLNIDYSPVLSVYGKSKNLDAARKFLDFIAEPTNSKDLAAQANGLSAADRAARTVPDYLSTLQPWLSVDKTRGSFPVFLPKEGADVYNKVGEHLQGMFTGDENTASLLKIMDDNWK